MHSVGTVDTAMTTPGAYGDTPLPKRTGAKSMLPSTWLERPVKVEYMLDPNGKVTSSSAKLLDVCPFGPVFGMAGARMCISWDCVRSIELSSG